MSSKKKNKKIDLQEIRIKDKWYAKDKNSNKIYDLELARLGLLEDEGLLDYNKETKKHYYMPIKNINQSKRNYKAISKYMRPRLSKLYKKKYIQYLDEEYKPGGPGYKIAEKRFNINKKKLGTKRVRSYSFPKRSTVRFSKKIKSI